MTIALICSAKDPNPWLKAFHARAPEIDVVVWPDIPDPSKVTFALCWAQPEGSLLAFKNLKAISSLGAGIDHLLADKQLPMHIPVSRIVAPNLAQGMFDYLLTAALDNISVLPKYRVQQKASAWQRQVPFAKTNIGIMGLGQIDAFCAVKFAQLGFKVKGYSYHPKTLANITTYTHEQLAPFLTKTDILICLLPLTQQTTGILNAKLFDKLPQGSYVINVARGGHLIEDDLLVALKRKQLSGACLDVFNQEPLAKNHPFWQENTITITPHCSSLTHPKSVVEQLINNYYMANNNKPLHHQVNLHKQY